MAIFPTPGGIFFYASASLLNIPLSRFSATLALTLIYRCFSTLAEN